MSTTALVTGIIAALIAGAALAIAMDNPAAGIISGISIGIVFAIAMEWERRSKTSSRRM